MNSLYIELKRLYTTLNNDFLTDLKQYAIDYYSIDLFVLIGKYAAIESDNNQIIEYIQELKPDHSISCMEDYYLLIDLMQEAKNV